MTASAKTVLVLQEVLNKLATDEGGSMVVRSTYANIARKAGKKLGGSQPGAAVIRQVAGFHNIRIESPRAGQAAKGAMKSNQLRRRITNLEAFLAAEADFDPDTDYTKKDANP